MASLTLRALKEILAEMEKLVERNRSRFDDTGKDIKDFRRMFDEQSAKMNLAIFNNEPSSKIHKETLNTIATLIEILSRV